MKTRGCVENFISQKTTTRVLVSLAPRCFYLRAQRATLEMSFSSLLPKVERMRGADRGERNQEIRRVHL